MKCPVCGNEVYDGVPDICPECLWEHDDLQEYDPYLPLGPNRHSLKEHRKLYKKLKRENRRRSA